MNGILAWGKRSLRLPCSLFGYPYSVIENVSKVD